MTTTTIYFEPYVSATSANGYATYDVEGSVKDSALNEYMESGLDDHGIFRINNNTYGWRTDIRTNEIAYTLKLDATNWPLDANATAFASNTISYTFPGGGTISAAQSGIAIRGRYIAERAFNFGGDNLIFTYTLNTHQGNTSLTAASPDYLSSGFPSVILDTQSKQYSPYRSYYLTSTQQIGNYFETGTETLVDYFDGDYAGDYVADQNIGGYVLDDYLAPETILTFDDTRANIKFFAHAIQGVRVVGTPRDDEETSFDLRYEYDWRSVWQVNLHSATTSTSSQSELSSLSGLALVGTAVATAETTATIVAAATVSTTIAAAIDAEFAAGDLIGVVQQATADNITIETAFVAGDLIGIVHPGTAQAQADAVWSETEPALLLGSTAQLEHAADSAAQARNLIGIGDGAGYITTDYAEADYFSEGTGLTIFADSTILSVDASVIRSDGTILFEGDFAAVIQPGFQIDAGIITQGDAAFEISPYTTAGTGLLFAAAADLSAQAQVAQALFGLLIDAVAALEQKAQTTILAGNRIESELLFAPVQFELVSDAESRPSIKAAITIGDDGRLTALAFVDNSSTSQITIGPAVVGPVSGGYLLSADVSIQQQIDSNFESTEARIFYIDMYYTSVVPAENRRYSTGSQARLFQIDSETRVNTCLEETRIQAVDPETRQADPALLPTRLLASKLFRIPA